MTKPKPASRIVISDKPRRRPTLVPTNYDDLRAWRIDLIQAAWRRVVARTLAEETHP